MRKIYQLRANLRMILVFWAWLNIIIFIFSIGSVISMVNAVSSIITFLICNQLLEEL